MYATYFQSKITIDVFRYWASKRLGADPPWNSDIDFSEMGAFERNLYVLDAVGDPPRFRGKRFGERVRATLSRDGIGVWLDEAYPAAYQWLGPLLTRCVTGRQPIWGLRWVHLRGETWVRSEILYLPLLGADGVEQVMGSQVILDGAEMEHEGSHEKAVEVERTGTFTWSSDLQYWAFRDLPTA